MPEACVILPCAGKGTRLGLPFPKELAPLGPGRAVIDSCLDLIRGASRNSRIKIVLLEDGTRERVADYIRDRLPDIPLACVRQHPEARDMSDAIMMLRPWFGKVNILLLPDAIYQPWQQERDPLSAIAREVMTCDFAFGAVGNPPALSSLGALRLASNVHFGTEPQPDRVELYEDKPADPSPYHAAWTIVGFSSNSRGMTGLNLMKMSALKETGAVGLPPIAGAPVIWLEDYRDCGTWESYQAELKRVL